MSRMRVAGVAAVVLGFLSGTPAIDPVSEGAASRTARSAPASVEAPRLNLLLLTVDTLRPDHLGAYGYERDTTPNLDRFAADAAVFPNAFSVSAWTFPGLVSVLTGLYPASHGYDARGRRIAPGIATLQGVLHDAGYRVPALSYVAGVPGIEALQVEERPSWIQPAGVGGSQLAQWLRSPAARERPFFAWHHYQGLHLPYDPAPPDDTVFGEVPATPGVDQVRRFVIIPAELQAFGPEDRQPVVDLYDGELRAFDRFFAEVAETLQETGLDDDTLVVVTADHGEELLEHGLVGHASTTRHATLFDEILRIPLLIRMPGDELRAPACQVSQVDVMPTVLSLLGRPVPDGLEGRDLSGALRGAPCEERTIFAESILGGFQARGESARNFVWAVRTPGWKLVVQEDSQGNGWRRLYDLERDPGEQRDRYSARPTEAARLEARLDEFFEAHGGADYWERSLEQAPIPRGSRVLAEVASPPRIVRPLESIRLDFETEAGMLVAEWTGSPVADYVVEYDVGIGRYRTTGRIPVVGNRIEFGPMPLDLWNALVDYNPWRFRVWPASAPQKRSPWIRVEIDPVRAPEPLER